MSYKFKKGETIFPQVVFQASLQALRRERGCMCSIPGSLSLPEDVPADPGRVVWEVFPSSLEGQNHNPTILRPSRV